jgi:hypothetical protein
MQEINFINNMKTPQPKTRRQLNPAGAAVAEDSLKSGAVERFNDNKEVVKEILAALQGFHADLRANLEAKEELIEQIEALEGKERSLKSKIDGQSLKSVMEIEQLE